MREPRGAGREGEKRRERERERTDRVAWADNELVARRHTVPAQNPIPHGNSHTYKYINSSALH